MTKTEHKEEKEEAEVSAGTRSQFGKSKHGPGVCMCACVFMCIVCPHPETDPCGPFGMAQPA